MNRMRIAVDFDGTICEDNFPDIGKPKPDVREVLYRLKELGYYIIIWSCRTSHWDYNTYGGDPKQPTLNRLRVADMIAWLLEHNIPYDEIDDGSRGKPSVDYYIDDKAISFKNNWESIFELLQTNLEPKIA